MAFVKADYLAVMSDLSKVAMMVFEKAERLVGKLDVSRAEKSAVSMVDALAG